jgi:hypothetical protein
MVGRREFQRIALLGAIGMVGGCGAVSESNPDGSGMEDGGAGADGSNGGGGDGGGGDGGAGADGSNGGGGDGGAGADASNGGPEAIAISPSTAELRVGASQEFVATVTGGDSSHVSWDSTCGSIEGDGASAVFTAPWGIEVGCAVTATSTADPSKVDTATIQLTVESSDQRLTNATFNATTDPWVDAFDRGDWSNDDAAGDPNSGSAKVIHNVTGNNGTRLGFTQCLSASPGQTFVFGGSARLVEQVSGASPRILFRAFSDGTCGGTSLASAHVTFAGSTWSSLQAEYTVPDGALSVRMELGLHKESGVEAEAQALFDNLFVFPAE